MSMLPVLNGNKVDGKTKGLVCGEGVTKQKTGVEHDINKLVAKFKRTGTMPSLKYDGQNLSEDGEVIDLTNIGDFQDCQNRIATAAELFDAYPSAIRRRFQNNIDEFVSFMGGLSDPKKLDEAVRLGLVELKKEAPKTEPKTDPKTETAKPADDVKK